MIYFPFTRSNQRRPKDKLSSLVGRLVASLESQKSNTTPTPPPQYYTKKMHYLNTYLTYKYNPNGNFSIWSNLWSERSGLIFFKINYGLQFGLVFYFSDQTRPQIVLLSKIINFCLKNNQLPKYFKMQLFLYSNIYLNSVDIIN